MLILHHSIPVAVPPGCVSKAVFCHVHLAAKDHLYLASLFTCAGFFKRTLKDQIQVFLNSLPTPPLILFIIIVMQNIP